VFFLNLYGEPVGVRKFVVKYRLQAGIIKKGRLCSKPYC
jgi:hypothetical protein